MLTGGQIVRLGERTQTILFACRIAASPSIVHAVQQSERIDEMKTRRSSAQASDGVAGSLGHSRLGKQRLRTVIFFMQ
jgi:hypothetical protein